jgi:PKHD-type hydroxylase
MWNFNITNLFDNLQFTEYTYNPEDKQQSHYDWHMDVGESASTRKISMSIQLTDEAEYDGGDLEFMIHRSIIKAPREKGTVIFFPSYLTHRVTKVTRGTRRSLVFWFHGPPFV